MISAAHDDHVAAALRVSDPLGHEPLSPLIALAPEFVGTQLAKVLREATLERLEILRLFE